MNAWLVGILAALAIPASAADPFGGKTFSNTQAWEPQYLRELEIYRPQFARFEDAISIANPYLLTTSESLASEIRELQRKVGLRTPAKILEIQRQQRFCGEPVGNFAFGRLPEIDRLVMAAYWEATYLGFFLKKQFDVVRPNFFDPTLTTVLPVPLHPAFPSNHALQNMVVALVLAELFPQDRGILIAHADAIAENREFAGLHYAVDRLAGQALAKWWLNQAKQQSAFTALIARAREFVSGAPLADFRQRVGDEKYCEALFF